MRVSKSTKVSCHWEICVIDASRRLTLFDFLTSHLLRYGRSNDVGCPLTLVTCDISFGRALNMHDAKFFPSLTIGKRIRIARKSKGWTLDQLARRLGISKVSISCWENDKSRPRASRLVELCAILDLPNELLVAERIETVNDSKQAATVVEHSQITIAQKLGARPIDVQINVSFGGARDWEGARISGHQFLALGTELRREQQRLNCRIVDLGINSAGKNKIPDLRAELERVNDELDALHAAYTGVVKRAKGD